MTGAVAAGSPHRRGSVVVPVGLVLLVGPPAAGKSSFARAWVGCDQIDAEGVVSCDAIRAQRFGARVRVVDDPAVFDEMDSRVARRLAAGLAVVVDATNVRPDARARMIAWARRYASPVTALLFPVEDGVLLRRNATRTGHARVPTEAVLEYAGIAADTTRAQLLSEGIAVVVTVLGQADDAGPADAAEAIHLCGRD